MKNSLPRIEKSFNEALSQAQDLGSLSKIRISILGKKGSLTQLLHSIGELPAKERPVFGEKVNQLRKKIEQSIAKRKEEFEIQSEDLAAKTETNDTGLPGRRRDLGNIHPLSEVEQKIISIFRTMGFSVEEGPEVETDYYNFESLNFPPEHPARDMQDTFFLEKDLVLRTHTSPGQIRTMEKIAPPLRILVPGRVYRHDSDITHSPVFHQVEGLCVGRDITFSHLKGTLETFVHMMFGKDTKTRFRPSFFPFTEPSAEVDVYGPRGWLEILGCGMVDPNVFEYVGRHWTQARKENPYDPERISGFAFGMGIERIAMVLYGISDIRLFYEHNVRFLEQFG